MREFYAAVFRFARRETISLTRVHVSFALCVTLGVFIASGIIRKEWDVTGVWIAVLGTAIAWLLFFLWNVARGQALVFQGLMSERDHFRDELNQRDQEVARLRAREVLVRELRDNIWPDSFMNLLRRFMTESEPGDDAARRQRMFLLLRDGWTPRIQRMRELGYEDQAFTFSQILAQAKEEMSREELFEVGLQIENELKRRFAHGEWESRT
jgi:hypothetical protein